MDARAPANDAGARAGVPASPCAAGLCWLIQLRGDDAARRAQLEAIARLEGFSAMRVPAAGARVPRYVGWKLASLADAHLDTTARHIAALGALAVVDRNL